MWMFGSRTTVKKVRNSLTWFSQKADKMGSHFVDKEKNAWRFSTFKFHFFINLSGS